VQLQRRFRRFHRCGDSLLSKPDLLLICRRLVWTDDDPRRGGNTLDLAKPAKSRYECPRRDRKGNNKKESDQAEDERTLQ
jgi:hypothetical protein